ncbi:type IV pilus assembly protein FimV [Paludibacterium paludis]|uniref:LysM domain-containing protein n=1 Tax=Paludibacterium paludis TaxID=1225769 RepID=A0A918NYH2_9NEIS|nr:LysM peptidoglycan-binding domain-containing protein [Paludibacterium paludis]GGY06790.1 hypothetical protein GCM10011289_06680 [Paludibacterium paludis]
MKRNFEPARHAASLMLLAAFGAMPGAACAGLGAIRVDSAAGQPFEADIPLVDETLPDDAAVTLADRNRYALISPYSPSAGKLAFTLLRRADGSVSGVRIRGPAAFDEDLLRFAVEVSWSAGRLVREFEVDYRRDGPRRSPSRDEPAKKALPPAQKNPWLGNLVLGGMRVLSRPGEPFLADIELAGTALAGAAGQAELMVVPELDGGALARELAARVAGMSVERLPADGARLRWRIRSEMALDAPVLAFRLEARVGRHAVTRRYTLLRTRDAWVMSGEGGLRYRVRTGDTLSSIAARLTGAARGVSMAKLVADNPGAFVDGDPDRLKAGALLRYPASWGAAGSEATRAAPSPQPAAVPDRAAPAKKSVADPEAERLKARLAGQEALLREAQARSAALEARMRDLAARERRAARPEARESGQVAPSSDPASLLLYGAAGAAALAGGAALVRRSQPKRDKGRGEPPPAHPGALPDSPEDAAAAISPQDILRPEMPLQVEGFLPDEFELPSAKEEGPGTLPDKQALARLYLEMGDFEAARALLGTAPPRSR